MTGIGTVVAGASTTASVIITIKKSGKTGSLLSYGISAPTAFAASSLSVAGKRSLLPAAKAKPAKAKASPKKNVNRPARKGVSSGGSGPLRAQ